MSSPHEGEKLHTGAIATINCRLIAENFRALQAMCAPAEVAATVKADAYGLGLSAIANATYDAGCSTYYVAHLSEAFELREILDDVAIHVLHGIPEGAEADAMHACITPVITDPGALERMRSLAKKTDQRLTVNLHIDTGMNRIGFSSKQWNELSEHPELLDGLSPDWVMSHFACSDEPHHPMNEAQREAFIGATKQFPHAKRSLCNSHGIFLGKQMHFDQVRPGRALSGGAHGLNGLQRAFSLHAPIIQTRSIDSDGTVGYGATQRVRKGMRLAALAYGYADGLHRAFSNNDQMPRHHFYLHGIAVPVMGRISMDLMMVDVSNVPEHLVHVGAMVEIAGPHQSIDDVAAQLGTIGYEWMTGLGTRIERRYVND